MAELIFCPIELRSFEPYRIISRSSAFVNVRSGTFGADDILILPNFTPEIAAMRACPFPKLFIGLE
jgi:hypothetical protein